MVLLLFCLCLSLAGITGLQFFYLAYLDRLDKDQKRRIRELERHCQKLAADLENVEAELEKKVEEQDALDDPVVLDEEDDNEVWADVLE